MTKTSVEQHYDQTYFENSQKTLGIMRATGYLFLFKKFIKPSDSVLDFGCGTGYFLKFLTCKEKLGMDINSYSRTFASRELGLTTIASIDEAPDNWADVIISSHVLEHCSNPLGELTALLPKLKKGGKFICLVPYERKVRYKPNDVNQHLFTWSEMNLGNLFAAAGYTVEQVNEIRHDFPPLARYLFKYVGRHVLHLACMVYGQLFTDITQVRIVAIKE